MNEIDEGELIRAGQTGAVVAGTVNGVKRTVPAELLRKCCHELRRQIDPRGLRLADAVVSGRLDLAGLRVAAARCAASARCCTRWTRSSR